MKKRSFFKLLSSVLSVTLLSSCLMFSISTATYADTADTQTMTAGGWYETIYAEIPGITDNDVTNVTYSTSANGTTVSNTLTGDDFTYLVRDAQTPAGDSCVRIDIPGISAGTYSITVTANGTDYTKENITVYACDRTGYAHYDANKENLGIGAYNDDGTLKDGAIVMYVTEENKNTVTIPGYENSPVGIGNILNYQSADTGSCSTSGKTELLKTFSTASTPIPLDIRFIGTIVAGDSNTKGDAAPTENILGLTEYNGLGNDGSEGDNGMMAKISRAANITFEGIGCDATIDGWGFQVVSSSDYIASGFEFRNLNFINTPEDAIGLQGSGNSSTETGKDAITGPIKCVWVHNNSFEKGFCATPTETDKADGDGSVDFKRGYGLTVSYNHFIENHKTNLLGAASGNLQYDCTFNHNYYENVKSRQPLVRQANVHILNSYFAGSATNTDYFISPRSNAYVFSEGNYYASGKSILNSTTESDIEPSEIKSYNDYFDNCPDDTTGLLVKVENKTETITSNNIYADFENSSDMYSYTAVDAQTAKAQCEALAGNMKNSAEIDMSLASVSSGSTDETTETTTENDSTMPVNKYYSFDSCETKTFTEAATYTLENGLQILSSGSEKIAESSQNSNDKISYQKYFQIGSGINNRYIKFHVDGSAEIKIALRSSSPNDARILNLYSSKNTNTVLHTFSAQPSTSSVSSETYSYIGGADDLLLCSSASAINIYSITIQYPYEKNVTDENNSELFTVTETYPSSNPNYFNINISDIKTCIYDILLNNTPLTYYNSEDDLFYEFPVFATNTSGTVSPVLTVKYADNSNADEADYKSISINLNSTDVAVQAS